MNKKVREFLINIALVLLSCTLLLIMAVYMYINDPAIKAENLSDEQLKRIYKDVYGVEV